MIMAFAVQTIVLLPLAIINMIVKDGLFAAISGTGKIVLQLAVFTLCFFNIERMRYCLRYKETAWFQNTGFLPSQVASDVGLYGEFIATMCAEQYLEHHHIYGKVFNSVIIPKRDGDFNEIDVISVSEHGIHVIEAKARTGEFIGTGTSSQWTQRCGRQEYTMQNPIMQNLTHCNFLTEFLYENLPTGTVENLLYSKIYNVVLFVLTGIKDNLNISDLPGRSFIGMAESTLLHKNYRRDTVAELDGQLSTKLTVEQIDTISAVLAEASDYTAAERQRMINDRTFNQEQKLYSHPVNYYVTKMYFLNSDEVMPLPMICRDNGYYKTYMDYSEKVFRAFPELVVAQRTQDCPDFNKVYTAYVKYLREHPELKEN